MSESKLEQLKKKELERQVRLCLYSAACERDPKGDYSGFDEIPYEALPFKRGEEKRLRRVIEENQFAHEQMVEHYFKTSGEITKPYSWPENLVRVVLGKKIFSVAHNTKRLPKGFLEVLSNKERECSELIYRDGKSWQEVCEALNCYVCYLYTLLKSSYDKLRQAVIDNKLFRKPKALSGRELREKYCGKEVITSDGEQMHIYKLTSYEIALQRGTSSIWTVYQTGTGAYGNAIARGRVKFVDEELRQEFIEDYERYVNSQEGKDEAWLYYVQKYM